MSDKPYALIEPEEAHRALETNAGGHLIDIREVSEVDALRVEGARNLPLSRLSELESRVWSMERQVRFAAGALVLSGVVLGAAVHPALFLLSGFVGAGLVFSAVTDTCTMALVLARLPWNRGSCGR